MCERGREDVREEEIDDELMKASIAHDYYYYYYYPVDEPVPFVCILASILYVG